MIEHVIFRLSDLPSGRNQSQRIRTPALSSAGRIRVKIFRVAVVKGTVPSAGDEHVSFKTVIILGNQPTCKNIYSNIESLDLWAKILCSLSEPARFETDHRKLLGHCSIDLISQLRYPNSNRWWSTYFCCFSR
jgi:hypothetical protein